MWFALNNIYCQTAITASQSYTGADGTKQATGEYQVFRSIFNSNIPLSNVHKPIILVEGFDPTNQYFPTPFDIYGQFYNVMSELNSIGYDIIVLRFDNSGDYIQRNAFLLMELITQVNAQKPNPNDKLTVIGYSLGGLIARYALTYMDSHAIYHQSSLFVSFDSPNKGAHIPASVQEMILAFGNSTIAPLFPQIQQLYNTISCPAAQQVLKYTISNNSPIEGALEVSSTYSSFMNELIGLNNCNGFPTNCRNIAISLGSWNSIAQRSNLTLNDPNGDFQQSGFPAFLLNFPPDQSGPVWIWNLTDCEQNAVFSFQSYLSTAKSDNYPYYSTRSSYAGLGNNAWATWFYNSNFMIPQGNYSDYWWYGDSQEPMDFAPGSNLPFYDLVYNALSSITLCNTDIISNSTFVPTVSALSFDTDNLFYDIYDDPDKMDKTPFSAIYGITGDNLPNLSYNDPTSDDCLRKWLENEIQGIYSTSCFGVITDQSCALGTQSLHGTLSSGTNVTMSNISDIVATNYSINSGATVTMQAGNSIVLKPGFVAYYGSKFKAKILPCDPKNCSWDPHPMCYDPPTIQCSGPADPACQGRYVELLASLNYPDCYYDINNITYNWWVMDPFHSSFIPLLQHTSIASLNVQYTGNYNFKVQAVNIYGVSNIAYYSFNVEDCHPEPSRLADKDTSSNKPNLTNPILIYPNPNEGNFSIVYKIGETETGTLKIYDFSGREVLNEQLKSGKNALSIDARNFEAGIYFYQAVVGNKRIAEDKIVVIK